MRYSAEVYLAVRYTERLAAARIAPSVGSVGDRYDNALAETAIGLFKTEIIYRRGPWRDVDHVEFATLAWVDWYNGRRLLEPLGHVPPVEYEAAYYGRGGPAPGGGGRPQLTESPANPGRFILRAAEGLDH